MLISDLTTEVLTKLGGVNDAQSVANCPGWIAAMARDLSIDFPFSYLETTGPAFQLTQGQALYPQANFLGSTTLNTIVIPDLLGRVINVQMWIVAGSQTGIAIPIRYRTPAVVKPMSTVPGMPAMWTKIGNNLLFAPNPIAGFYIQFDYQKQHPFSNPVRPDDTLDFEDDWKEILVYGAAEKGADELRMLDYSSAYHAKLYNNPSPKDPAGTPVGLIVAKKTQYARLGLLNERQFQPVIMPSQR